MERGASVVIRTEDDLITGICEDIKPANRFRDAKITLSSQEQGGHRRIVEVTLPASNVFVPEIGRGINREETVETERLAAQFTYSVFNLIDGKKEIAAKDKKSTALMSVEIGLRF